MRHRFLKFSSCLLITFATGSIAAYEGSSYASVHTIVFSAAYSSLPHYSVDKRFFGRSGNSERNLLFTAAKRTLQSQQDVFEFPQGRKLFNANGICFSGQWIIDKASKYSGQFSRGTRSLAIVRASVALGGTKQKDKRGFGMAIKLFPTLDPDAVVPTSNAFVLHSLGGIKTKHLLSLPVDNAPALGSLPSLSQWRTALRLRRDLEKADEVSGSADPDSSYRSVEPLARASHLVSPGDSVVAPALLRLTVKEGTALVDKQDFRDELRLENYPEQKLTWVIDVAAQRSKNKSDVQWQTLGKLVVSESITSPGCDQQLHFAHPLNP